MRCHSGRADSNYSLPRSDSHPGQVVSLADSHELLRSVWSIDIRPRNFSGDERVPNSDVRHKRDPDSFEGSLSLVCWC